MREQNALGFGSFSFCQDVYDGGQQYEKTLAQLKKAKERATEGSLFYCLAYEEITRYTEAKFIKGFIVWALSMTGIMVTK
jgi:hypothetical protein